MNGHVTCDKPYEWIVARADPIISLAFRVCTEQERTPSEQALFRERERDRMRSESVDTVTPVMETHLEFPHCSKNGAKPFASSLFMDWRLHNLLVKL